MRPMPQATPRSSARLVALIVGFLAPRALRASAATVATDKADYAPGENVVITGSGWEPGETVVLILHEDPELDPDLRLTAFADSNGDFTNTDFTVDVFDIGVTFTLTATGLSSGQTAETTFTDAPGTCGNGTVETGEDCDLGSALNGAAGSCCKNNCTFASSTNTCRAAAGDCDLPETCTGSSATCPADGPGPPCGCGGGRRRGALRRVGPRLPNRRQEGVRDRLHRRHQSLHAGPVQRHQQLLPAPGGQRGRAVSSRRRRVRCDGDLHGHEHDVSQRCEAARGDGVHGRRQPQPRPPVRRHEHQPPTRPR